MRRNSISPMSEPTEQLPMNDMDERKGVDQNGDAAGLSAGADDIQEAQNVQKQPIDVIHDYGGNNEIYPGQGMQPNQPPQPGYPGQQQPGYPDQQQPGYPGQQQPGYPDQQQPGYPGQQQPGYPGQQPGYPGQQQPGYPGQQPGYPGHPEQSGHQSQPEPHSIQQQPQNEAPAADQGDEAEQWGMVLCVWILSFILLPITMWVIPGCFKVVMHYERGIVLRQGRAISKIRKPGLTFLTPFIDELMKCDMRTIARDVPPQEILTKDSATVMIDAVLYYRVFDPYLALIIAEDVHNATSLLAQTTIRGSMGGKTLSEILSAREEMSKYMLEYLDDVTDKWGIKVERVELKDVRLPYDMQRVMASEAEASREARAKIIQAEGEHMASLKLKEAAMIINQSDSAIQLRFLQTMTQVSNQKNHTVIMPLDTDVLRGIQRRMASAMKA